MGLKLKKAWSKIQLRKHGKHFRKSLGLTSENRWIRGIKKRFNLGAVSSSQPTSAATVPGYQYSGRTLSQLTGGV